MTYSKIISALALISIVAAMFIYRDEQVKAARPIGKPQKIATPLGLPPVPVPADNPLTVEKVAVGKRLFFDKSLSVDNSISCAKCHDPGHGFAYAGEVSTGVGGKEGTRNSPTILNTAYYSTQFWDGREKTLEKQAEGPVQNPVEMAHSLTGVVERLGNDPSYVSAFKLAFGAGPVTFEKVEKSIAAYERTLVVGDSPFDRWYFGGDQNAIDKRVKRGYEVFHRVDKGNCASCHTIAEHTALFTDNEFHNIGVGVKNSTPTDLGRYEVTHSDRDRGAFKTPSLRNIAETAPYMHDGSLDTLEQVIDFHAAGGNANPWLDFKIRKLQLTTREKADLVAFLKSLSGEVPSAALPDEDPQ
ncbi:MAG TPA: cytochrome c peroxidase [Candidatus Angelobacter sp.]|jgi:cytochrome c peroxidase